MLLPALLVILLFDNPSSASRVLQWVFALVMALGWCANTAMAAYRYPRVIFSSVLIYGGVNLLIVFALYKLPSMGIRLGTLPLKLIGITSFAPLNIISMYLYGQDLPRETYIIFLMVALLLASWASGIVFRVVNARFPCKKT